MIDRDSSQHRSGWRRRPYALALGVLALLVVLHLAGDYGYSRLVAAKLAAWEAKQQRDNSGVLAGCDGYELPPSAGADRQTAILLVHGLGASSRHYDLVAPALAELGYRVRVLRLPGFAEPLPKYAASKAEDWTGVVLDALKQLRAESPRVGVVGHSLGGATVTNVLLNHPEAADFAVLLAPAVSVCNARSPLLSVRSWHEVSQRTLVFTDVLGSAFPMDCRDRSRENHPGRTPFTPTAVIDELFGLMDENAPRAEELRLPLTLVVSADDLVVDTAAAEAFFERVSSAEKERLVLRGSGHELPLDLEWPLVVEAIARRANAVGSEVAPESPADRHPQ